MIPRQRQYPHVMDRYCVLAIHRLDYDRLFVHTVSRENRDLGLIDNRHRHERAERAHIRDGKCAAHDIVRTQLLGVRSAGEVAHFTSDESQAFAIHVTNYRRDQTYADRGCNFELYTDANILEVETLGPLATLAPGEKTEHTEIWSLFSGVGPIGDEASIATSLLPLLGT